MSVDPWRYFAIARQVAVAKDDRRTHRLGAVGVRSDGVLVCASNGPARAVPRNPKKTSLPGAHAEARLCRKMDKRGVVFVVRINAGGYSLARPCPNCQRTLRSRKVVKVYYTISNNEYGVLSLL